MSWYKTSQESLLPPDKGNMFGDLPIPDSSDLVCPFCKDVDFDAAGLKNHLQLGDCDVYNRVDTSGMKRLMF